MSKFKIKVSKDSDTLVAEVADRDVNILESKSPEFSEKFNNFVKLVLANEGENLAEVIDRKKDKRVREKYTYRKLSPLRFKGYFIRQLRMLGYMIEEL